MAGNVDIPWLLLDCLGGNEPGRLAALLPGAGNEEWEGFVEAALRHEAGPFVYFRLKKTGLDKLVPSRIMTRLHTACLQSAARNFLIFEELKNILRAFAEREIPVILLKGAYLAAKVYEDIALRPMCDLDILVQKQDLGRAETALRAIGYSSPRPYIPEVDSVCHQHILPFTKEKAPPVEVHWNIFDPEDSFNLDTRGLWERARPCSVAGCDALSLGPEDLFLHLAIHCTYHHCFQAGLLKLYDITLLAERHGVGPDWRALLERAGEWGFDRCLLLTLKMISFLFGARLPENVVLMIDEAGIGEEMVQAGVEQLFGKPSDTILSPAMTDLVERKSLFRQVTFLFSRVFPSRIEMSRMYPVATDSLKIYLYYPKRIKRLLQSYGKGLWRIARGDKPALEKLEGKRKMEQIKLWMRKEM